MHFKRLFLLASTSVALVAATAFAVRQDDAPPEPQPTAEHKILMERLGTWDAAMKIWMAPGAPMETKGVETNRALGPFHVVGEFESTFMGEPFQGHSITSWDPSKKKYISVWIDSGESAPSITEGTYDPRTRTLTFVGESMMMGQLTKMRQVVTTKDADHALFEMYTTGSDGKESKMMEMAYTRRK